MSAPHPLERLRHERFFGGWDGYVISVRVSAAEACLRQLVEDLASQSALLTEPIARAAVAECVRRFNAMDDGWICTIEREDICEQIARVVTASGFDCDDDWLNERDW